MSNSIPTQSKSRPNTSGVAHWKWHRISAIILVPLSLWLMFSMVQALSYDYETARAWLSQAHVAILLLLWLIAAIYHGQLGLEIIIEDYISDLENRRAIIRISNTLLYVGLVLAIISIIRIAFL